MRRFLAVLFLPACMSSFQSARTLPKGKTQVTADLDGFKAFDSNDSSETVYAGELMVRNGLDDGLEGGVRLGRLPGDSGDTASLLMLDLKKQVSDPATTTSAISVDIPLGIAWSEQGTNLEGGTFLAAPTLLVGVQVSPSAEVVLGPKFVWVVLSDSSDQSKLGGGVSMGLRISDPSRTWAVHPELSLLKVEDADTIISFGLAVSAGN